MKIFKCNASLEIIGNSLLLCAAGTDRVVEREEDLKRRQKEKMEANW